MKRRSAGRETETVIYGIHAVAHCLESFPDRVIELLVAEDRQDRRLGSIVETALKAGLKAVSVDRRILDGRAAGGAHQGVLAMIRPRPPGNENDLAELLDGIPGKAFLLILDGVQDPHNLGACLRTADAAGIHAVVAPRNRAAGLTPAVRKVACGASETVPFMQVTNLARTLRELGHRNIRRIGADGHAPVSIFEADLSGSIAIVMGAEGRGLRRLTRENCDLLVSLPMLGAVESLNVSVATGICLYAALGQRPAGKLASDTGFD